MKAECKTYFHVSEKQFKPGDVKQPSYGDEPIPDVDPFAEGLREQIRAEHFSTKPSRLKSNFVWESSEDAAAFRYSFRPASHFIYEVRFVNEPTVVHRACCRLPWHTYKGGQLTYEAGMYWKSPAMYGLVENFAEEAIVIVRQVDPPVDDKAGSTVSTTRSESSPLEELTRISKELDGIDVDCYNRHRQDSHKPILGLGRADARWCFFGRDPGEQEVLLQKPFVGDAGLKIRAVMAECGLSDDDVYWMNTVPFKPIGNKPWSVGVRRRCHPTLLKLLAKWDGASVITFGEAAFKWFGLGSSQDRQTIEQFWKGAEKYQAQLPISLELAGVMRRFILCPVPHPSGANATWSSRFPDLLASRLRGTPD